MLKHKEIDNQTIGGIELFTLEEAMDKSKKEGFVLLHQSKVALEAYGVLKPFSSNKQEGLYFIPVLIKGEMVTL